MRSSAFATLAIGLAVLAAHSASASAQQFTHGGPVASIPVPVELDTTGTFRARFVRVGDDLYIAGQPTEAGLRRLKALGVTTIVNLRTPREMERVGYDEPALASALGMTYIAIPVRGDSLLPYSPATVAKFTEALNEAKGNVLLHCTSAWRASHLWAAYLIDVRHVDVETALANARLINLDDSNPELGKRPQPVESFLGRQLPTLGQPKR